jgi:hypothetical protein
MSGMTEADSLLLSAADRVAAFGRLTALPASPGQWSGFIHD